jgi:hypothetical protein
LDSHDNSQSCMTADCVHPIRVALVDSGFDRTLIEPRVVGGAGIASRFAPLTVSVSSDDADAHGHGTACAHLLLGANAQVEIVPVRVFGDSLETSPAVLCAAIGWAVHEARCQVINLSLGTRRTDAARAIYIACEDAARHGVTIVASCDNVTGGGYPAMFDVAIGVGPAEGHEIVVALDEAPECRAPSRQLRTVGLGGRPCIVSGTSFGTPLVTARVAYHMRHGAVGLHGVRRALAADARESGNGC